MTLFAKKMQIFLWQIATVIPIKGTRASAWHTSVAVKYVGFNTWLRYSHKFQPLYSLLCILSKVQ